MRRRAETSESESEEETRVRPRDRKWRRQWYDAATESLATCDEVAWEDVASIIEPILRPFLYEVAVAVFVGPRGPWVIEIAIGDRESVKVPTEKIIALVEKYYDARALFLTHSHCSRDARPSVDDKREAERLRKALRPYRIRCTEIVTGLGVAYLVYDATEDELEEDEGFLDLLGDEDENDFDDGGEE